MKYGIRKVLPEGYEKEIERDVDHKLMRIYPWYDGHGFVEDRSKLKLYSSKEEAERVCLELAPTMYAKPEVFEVRP